MEYYLGIFLIVCIIGLAFYGGIKFYNYRINVNDATLVGIEVHEKDIEAVQRFFVTAKYASGREVLITPERLSEDDAYKLAEDFYIAYLRTKEK